MVIDARTDELVGISWSSEQIFQRILGGSGQTNWIVRLRRAQDITDPFMQAVVAKLGGTSTSILRQPQGSQRADGYWIILKDVMDDYSLHLRIVVALDERDLIGSLDRQRIIVSASVGGVILLLIIVQAAMGGAIVNSLSGLVGRMGRLELSIGDMKHQGARVLKTEVAAAEPQFERQSGSSPSTPRAISASSTGSGKRTSVVSEVAKAEQAFSHMEITIQSFARFVPKEVVCDLLNNGKLANVGMQPAHCCICFIDIENFTRMSESIHTEDLAAIMEAYFDTTTKIIHEHGGSVDKYIGDCTMAIWGAPLRVDYANVRGVACALSIKRAVELPQMQTLFRPTGLPCRVRIGLHSGNVLAGNMGGHHRLNYTLIGAAVNLAARLEPLNKEFGTRMLISDVVNDEICGVFVTRLCHKVQVMGFATTAKVYEVRGIREEFSPSGPVNHAQLKALAAAADVASRMAVHDIGGLESSELAASSSMPSMNSDEEARWASPVVGASSLPQAQDGNPLDLDVASVHSNSQGSSSQLSGDGQAAQQLRLEWKDITDILRAARTNLPIIGETEQRYCSTFDVCVKQYLKGNFSKAMLALTKCEELMPESQSTLLHQRCRRDCETMINTGGTSPKGWDGVLVLTHK